MRDAEAAELARALAHPLRLGFLGALKRDGLLSPVEYSRQSGEALSNVSYHVKTLEQAEVIEVLEQVQRRGTMEHRYRIGGARSQVALAMFDLLAAA